MTRGELLEHYHDALNNWHEVEIKREFLIPAIEQIISDLEDATHLTMNTQDEQHLTAANQGYWTAILDLVKKA